VEENMSKKTKKKILNNLGKEGLPEVQLTEIETVVSSPAEVHALYKKLSVDEQADLLKLILNDEDLPDISQVVQKITAPGAIDLLLDRISYYHFFPAVKEK
jgi:hypothetical protein